MYEPVDASVRGIVVGVLQSEGFGLDAAGYEGFIREFLTTFEAGASDAYGRPEPRLYASAVFDPEFAPLESENVLAIATRIVPGTVDRPSPQGRNIVVFRTAFDGQAWRIIGLLTGGDPISLAQFLDPTGETATQAAPDGLFTFWRRWEG